MLLDTVEVMEVQGPLETLVGVEAVAPLEAIAAEVASEETLEGTAVEEAQVDGPQAPEDTVVEEVLEEAPEGTAVEEALEVDTAAEVALEEALVDTAAEEALEEALEGTAVVEAQVDGPQALEDIAVEVALAEALEDTAVEEAPVDIAAEEAMEEEVDLSGYKEDWMFKEEFDSTV